MKLKELQDFAKEVNSVPHDFVASIKGQQKVVLQITIDGDELLNEKFDNPGSAAEALINWLDIMLMSASALGAALTMAEKFDLSTLSE